MMVHTASEVKGFLSSQTCPSLIKGVISTPWDQKCDIFALSNLIHTSQAFFR